MNDINITPDLVARFWGKVAVQTKNQCWPFTGLKNRKGYGQFGIGQDMVIATHVSLALSGEKRPTKKHQACHRCDNPECVNPTHLYWGTAWENSRDMWERNPPSRLARNGQENPASKLDDNKVREIRSSPLGPVALGRKFGVSTATIIKVIRRSTWKHVT